MANLQLAVKGEYFDAMIRGDFFYLNSLRRVLFYGDDYDLFNIQPSNVTEIPARP